ncbi:hypothetical protein GCM10023081_46920 [Arthrobacter ginkgonis]|uniref:RecT family protein n=1 Tax=Arthrobacter ginkgonis TaxID=1630594 RepID=A0ABP7DK43_9MICC
MTELATRNTATLDTSPAAILSTPASGTIKLAEWAQELTAAHQLGTALCGTDFVPADFRGKPEAAAAAILAGKSLGLDPMNALSNIFVVHGRPALYARTMAALVMNAGHEVIRTAASPESVTVAARRKGQTQWTEFTWTIQRAQQAGYMSNKKYTTDPIAMLTAKAQAEACRTIAPDVLTGVASVSVEEVELENLGERPAVQSVAAAFADPAPAAPEPAAAPAPASAADVFADPGTGEVLDAEPVNYFDEIEARSGDVTALRHLWSQASNAGEPQDVLDAIATAASNAKAA